MKYSLLFYYKVFYPRKVARKKIEEKIEELELIIDNARSQRDEVEIEEHDIRSYIRNAKYMMEHIEDLLINPDNFATQRALIDLMFDVIPTYSDILNGTPKVQPLFRLSEQFKVNKSQLVSLLEIEPNDSLPCKVGLVNFSNTKRPFSSDYKMRQSETVLS